MGCCTSTPAAAAAQVHPLRRTASLQGQPSAAASAAAQGAPSSPPRQRAALHPDVEALLAPSGGLVLTRAREVTVADAGAQEAAHGRRALAESPEGSGGAGSGSGGGSGGGGGAPSPLAALPLSTEETAAAAALPLGSGGDSGTESCATSLPTVHHTEANQHSPHSTLGGGGRSGSGTAAAEPTVGHEAPAPVAAPGQPRL